MCLGVFVSNSWLDENVGEVKLPSLLHSKLYLHVCMEERKGCVDPYLDGFS